MTTPHNPPPVRHRRSGHPAGDGRWRAHIGAGWNGIEGRPNGRLISTVEEDVELWDHDGQQVAMSRQLAVVQPAA